MQNLVGRNCNFKTIFKDTHRETAPSKKIQIYVKSMDNEVFKYKNQYSLEKVMNLTVF